MFFRKMEGLPRDPIYPSDLKTLGYFVNDVDEIRSIKSPEYYFKYFLTKSDRVNDRQRFHFYEGIKRIIHARLENLGLCQLRLPLNTTIDNPHVPIFASNDLLTKERIVMFVGESSQFIGAIAHRIIGGKGGINRGSVIDLVKLLLRQRTSKTNASPPGIVIANTGDLWWWPEGKKALNWHMQSSIPLKSAVHWARVHDESLNQIPENKDQAAHIAYLFTKVIPSLTMPKVKIDIVTVGDGCDYIEEFLDVEANWKTHGSQLHALAMMGPTKHEATLRCEGLKTFLAEKGRAWVCDSAIADTPLADVGGNPNIPTFTDIGCPIFSSSEEVYIEKIPSKAALSIVSWLQEVALTDDYRNPPIKATLDYVVKPGGPQFTGNIDGCSAGWMDPIPNGEEIKPHLTNTSAHVEGAGQDHLPIISFETNNPELEKERKLVRQWQEFQKSGRFDAEEDSE